MLVSISLRNTLFHLKQFTQTKLFWIKQFINFFSINDYKVPGYTPPEIKINLQINLKSILFGYSHSIVVSNSPMLLRLNYFYIKSVKIIFIYFFFIIIIQFFFFFRLEIGQCHLISRIIADMPRWKFDCEWEESNLWMLKKCLNIKKINKNPIKDIFVKVLHIGCLNFTVNHLTKDNFNSENYPKIELNFNNDFIKVIYLIKLIILFYFF